MLHISIPVYICLQFSICYVLYMQPNRFLDRTQMLHTHSLDIFYVSVQFEATTFDHKYIIHCSEFIEVSNTIYLYIRRVLQYVSPPNIYTIRTKIGVSSLCYH
jgi:hypothetical protein